MQTYSKKHPQQMPTALEAGTLNGHGIAGLDAALDYLKQTGMDEIREKEQTLMWQFYEGIRDISGVKIYGDFHRKTGVPLYPLISGIMIPQRSAMNFMKDGRFPPDRGDIVHR